MRPLRHLPPRAVSAVWPRRLVAGALLVAATSSVAMGCEEGGAAAGSPSPRGTVAQPSTAPRVEPAARPAAETAAPLSTLCARLAGEQGALNLGAPLRDRVAAFPDAARRWLAQEEVAPAVRAALERLVDDRADLSSLSVLHAHASAFDGQPSLLVDATLSALAAVDAAAHETNAPVLELLARARGWLPGEATLPWIEALLVPERGGRRALLAEAFAAGERHPALVVALARASLREGDAARARELLDLLATDTGVGPSAARGGPEVGRALRERAGAVELALRAGRAVTTRGVQVVGPAALELTVAQQLAEHVRADLDEAAALVGGPPRAALTVWLHPSQDDLRAATCGAGWSAALYDGVLHVTLAGAGVDARLRQSVRHEALHAQLDALTPLAPRWLQEGVAQRFAGEPIERGAAAPFAPSPQRFEELERALGPGAANPAAGAAYAAARALVDELVVVAGEPLLRELVEAIRAGRPTSYLAQQATYALTRPESARDDP